MRATRIVRLGGARWRRRTLRSCTAGVQGGWIWAETIAALAAQSGRSVRTLVLDVPGCGTKRGRDTSLIEFDDIATELVADIEASGMRNVMLIGHSQAGMAMPRMVEFRRDLFAKLVYISCAALPPDVRLMERMGQCLHGERDDQVGWPVDPKTSTAPERARALFCNDMSAGEADAFLAKLGEDNWPLSSYDYRDWRYDHLVDMPSTFVHCLRDTAMPPIWQQRHAATFRVKRSIYIDAGHQVMNTKAHELAKVLLAEANY